MNEPLKATYKRDPDTVYSILSPKDGEILTYYGKCERPSSNAFGYRRYRKEDGTLTLVNIKELEEIKE